MADACEGGVLVYWEGAESVSDLTILNRREQICAAGRVQPHWRNDGREIVYLSPDGALMSVALKPAGSSLEAAPPVLVVADPKIRLRYGYTEQWTMSSDASKFYVIASRAQPEAPITVVINWLGGVRK